MTIPAFTSKIKVISFGILPSVEQGLLNLEDLIVSGDGSILESNASGQGKSSCSCRLEGNYNCQHDRIYSSPTAKWCYDAHKDCSELSRKWN